MPSHHLMATTIVSLEVPPALLIQQGIVIPSLAAMRADITHLGTGTLLLGGKRDTSILRVMEIVLLVFRQDTQTQWAQTTVFLVKRQDIPMPTGVEILFLATKRDIQMRLVITIVFLVTKLAIQILGIGTAFLVYLLERIIPPAMITVSSDTLVGTGIQPAAIIAFLAGVQGL